MSSIHHNDSVIKYRPDIDGLRAIAVVSVVLYHFFPSIIPGGFIGVDIFFVISGYLITSIILRKYKDGKPFNFLDFYARRVKRIFPALSVVLIACLAFGWYALLDNEYKQLGKHIIGSTFFSQNLLLLSESNYFDNASVTKPLLHLWSLGIEEQFYLLWPLIIYFCITKRKNFTRTISFIGIASFIIGLYYIYTGHNSAAYYSPESRIWELMVGGGLAWLRNKGLHVNSNLTLSNLTVAFGMLLLACGVYLIDKNKAFPGFLALVPTLASSLIIISNPNNWFSKKILSSNIMVYIGLISYPLYLWHWPLISFAWIINSGVPSHSVKIILLIASFLLSWLTYALIEKPIRNATHTKKTIFKLFIIMGFISAFGGITYINNGFPNRQNAALKGYPGDIGHDEFHKYIATHFMLCTPAEIANTALKWNNYTRCMQSKPGNKIDLVLLGDSHAEHLFIGIAEALNQKNVAFYIEDGSPFQSNNKFSRLYEAILKNEHIKTVVLTMYWHGRAGEVPEKSTLENEITKTAKLFTAAGKRVILTDDVADFPFTPDKCKGQRWLSHNQPVCAISKSESDKQREIYQSALKDIADKNRDIILLSERDYLCDREECSMVKDGKLMYRDTHHLNINGSRYIGEKLVTDNPGAFK